MGEKEWYLDEEGYTIEFKDTTVHYLVSRVANTNRPILN